MVLANYAGVAEATVRYATALGAPLHLPLTMLPLEEHPLEPELELEPLASATEQTWCNEVQTAAGLRAVGGGKC